MIINWFGQSCFKIQGNQCTIITDPFDKSCGLRVPRLAADVVTVSHDDANHNNFKAVSTLTNTDLLVIKEPGEYEFKNAFVYGIALKDNGQTKKDVTLYRLEVDGISMAHLGGLRQGLDNGQVEKLEGVDILMIPVGGLDSINAKQATEIISQLEPRIIIPMHYQIAGLKSKLDSLDKFCKEIGVCPTEEVTKFKIAKKDLPQEDLKIVILQP